MRVLLVNDASGVHSYLKSGLMELGHEVLIGLAGTNSFQGRKTDLVFGVEGAGVYNRIKRIVLPYLTLRGLGNFDVINYSLGVSVFTSALTKYQDLGIVKRNGAKISYYGLGCDEVSLLRVRSDMSQLACSSCSLYDELGRGCERNIHNFRTAAAKQQEQVDFSISSSYLYSHCHSFFPRAIHANIPLPVDVSSIPFRPAKFKSKPVIIHSPTRRGFKGSAEIISAIDLLSTMRDDFEFRQIENLDHASYLAAMNDCDIYLDQVLSGDAFGMAALENLAAGKIVVSGNGPKNWAEFPETKNSPIISAASEPKVMANLLSDLLDSKSEFTNMAESGRSYVEANHSHILIAEKFARVWGI